MFVEFTQMEQLIFINTLITVLLNWFIVVISKHKKKKL